MLLVLFPVPYVDASPSAALPSKWQRAAVAAAGIAVELTLAALAALVWARLEPGILRAAAFNVMLIGGVSSLLVNGNPLLRFDGYYVLSDLIEVPNLVQRGPRYLLYLLNRFVFRVPGLEPVNAPLHERIAALTYTPLSWCYRMFVMLAVASFVAANYFIAGVAMAAVTLAMGIAWPVANALWQVAMGARYRLCRGRAAGLTFGGLALAALALLFVPVPVHSSSEGIIWVPREAIVRAGTDGFILRVEADPGATVTAGTPLFALEHPIAGAKRQVSAARVQELRAKYNAEWVSDRIGAQVTQFELDQEQANLSREDYRAGMLRVTAADAGTFQTIRPAEDMQGRYVKMGEILGYVTPPEGRVARVVVPQSEIELVEDHLIDVHIRLADRHTDLRSVIVRAVPAADQDLPSSALTVTNGGSIATDPRDDKHAKAFERLFQFDVALPESDALTTAGFGSRVFVRFDFNWQSVGAVLYRHVRQALLSRFEV
jgi:putative peptide zinc metalloprotease protein